MKDIIDFEIYSNGPLKADTITSEAFGIKAIFST